MTLLVPLRDADDDCGAKSATLGALLRHGINVPPGVVVLAPASTAWRDALAGAIRRHGAGPYAVRSSALGEDGCDASFAGQFLTSLNVPGDFLIEAVTRTARSVDGSGVAAYTDRIGTTAIGAMPVLVQQMISADVSGVLFTRHPMTGATHSVLEANRGLGVSVVDGTTTPERWIVSDGAATRDQSASDAVLTSTDALRIAALGHKIEELLGAPQDIEWAIAAGVVWVLQSRPITVSPPRGTEPESLIAGAALVVGTPASPGRGQGPVRVIRSLDDFVLFQPGDVLVCRTTSPAWTPLMAVAAAVVTEVGGILSHAAIVAREFRIPAVAGAPDAVRVLDGLGTVDVDGDRGVVSADHLDRSAP